MKHLAVVGLGPKGAAIAAKATILRRAGFDAPKVTAFEPSQTAAAWSGVHGYTDGEQELCTLAERDVGYPYDRATYWEHPGVAEQMFATFSWHQFAVSKGIDETSYDRWVMRGRRPPRHRDFADYLDHVVNASDVTVERTRVTQIDFDPSARRWIIDTDGGPHPHGFDGVVVTGSGKPFPPLPNANARVFDGRTFWQNIPAIRRLLRASDPIDQAIAIIGSGGTGAAVALWLVQSGMNKIPVHIIGREASLYSRSPGYFEDRLFSDTSEWEKLAPHTRDAFVSRLTQGVVWNSVMQGLNRARNLTYRAYSARGFQIVYPTARGLPDELQLELDYPPPLPGVRGTPSGPPAERLAATVFIDARGFDRWWFVDDLMAPRPLSRYFSSRTRDQIIDLIDEYLSIWDRSGAFPAGLHVPMLASRQGPAAPNLMALGWMSDQILRPYVQP